MEIQVQPIEELRRWILEGDAAIAALPDCRERDVCIAAVKALRARLPMYAEHRWEMRAWANRKTRKHRCAVPGPGPNIVA